MVNSTPKSTSSSPLLKTTISLILLQLISRLFSFSLNQLLLRSTTPQALGVATMGLEVVRDTGLFLLREGIRGSVIRSRNKNSSSSSSTKATLISQTLLIPTLLSPLLSFLFLIYYFFPPTPLPPYFNLTLSLYALSGILELISEKYYLITLLDWETLTSLRVRIEGLAVGFKALGTLGTVLLVGEKGALVAFGVGQVVYALALLGGLSWFVGNKKSSSSSTSDSTWSLKKITLERGAVIVEGTRIEEKQKENEKNHEVWFDPEMISLGWALTKQSFVKQFLTEGDKIVVGRFSKVEDQGGYAIALNYGSLVARLLFQPLEETSRLYFSQSLSVPTPSTLLSTSSLLSSLLLLHTHLSLIFLLLAPSFTSPLLFHLLGTRWSTSSAPVILSAYCTYLPFLAINGITEAFFQSVAEEKWLRKGSAWMGICSAGFIAFVLLGMMGRGTGGTDGSGGVGEIGLIYANCFNMFLRIGFSSYFIKFYFNSKILELDLADEEVKRLVEKNLNWRTWTPKFGTLIVFGIVSYLVKWSEGREKWRSLKGFLEHLGIGAIGGLICLGVIYFSEKEALARLKNIVRHKKE